MLGFGKKKVEKRNYTSQILAGVVAEAEGSVITSSRTLACVETAAGLWGRAFGSATLEPADDKLKNITPAMLAHIGRQLVKRGDVVFHFDVMGSSVMFDTPSQWDIIGSNESWQYDMTFQRPSGTDRINALRGSVLHFMHSYDSERPYCGVSPLTGAISSIRLITALERALSEECGTTTAYLLPIPADGGDGSEDDTLKLLRQDIENAKGKPLLLETTAGGWGEGRTGAPMSDWKPQRLGANIPQSLVVLREQCEQSILATCGVSPALAYQQAQGTTLREAWRQFLHGTISPVAQVVANEIKEKLELDELNFNFNDLMASDISGRARAFQSLVGGGMDVERAASLSGVMSDDTD